MKIIHEYKTMGYVPVHNDDGTVSYNKFSGTHEEHNRLCKIYYDKLSDEGKEMYRDASRSIADIERRYYE